MFNLHKAAISKANEIRNPVKRARDLAYIAIATEHELRAYVEEATSRPPKVKDIRHWGK